MPFKRQEHKLVYAFVREAAGENGCDADTSQATPREQPPPPTDV
jgi:hypothetical protein